MGGEVPKIMVTYNGLPKLLEFLSTTCNPYEDYKLLIDEYHEVLGQYSFRHKAIDALLVESLKFKDKCFLSATPIHPTYCPSILKDLNHYEIIWAFSKKVIPTRIKTNKPYMAAVNIIKQYKAGGYSMDVPMADGSIKKSYEAYFFINSVRAIKDVIDNAGLIEKEYKIICADNDKNKATLDDLPIGKVSDPNKPFTFVTSKSFVGTDFYSETGLVYVLSNVSNTNTLLDISSEIFQISGRIRNEDNPFKNSIVHIYNTGASDLTPKEFENVIKQKSTDTNLQISGYAKLTLEEQNSFKDRLKDNKNTDYTYFNELTNQVEFNELKRLNEKFEYEIVRLTYTDGITLREAYNKNQFELKSDQKYEFISEDFVTNLSSIQFREVLKEYCELIDLRNGNAEEVPHERIQYLENLNMDIKIIVDTLGTGKVRTLKYSKTQIAKQMKNEDPILQQKLFEELNSVFLKDIIYISSEVKIKLQTTYDKLNINKKAIATDLAKYFRIDKKNRKINGKVQDSIIILK